MNEGVDVGQVGFEDGDRLAELTGQQRVEYLVAFVEVAGGQRGYRGAAEQEDTHLAGGGTRLMCEAVVS